MFPMADIDMDNKLCRADEQGFHCEGEIIKTQDTYNSHKNTKALNKHLI